MKLFFSWLGVILGVVGILLSVAGLVGVWIYYPQWTHKTQEIYAKIDEALVLAGDRIEITRQRVRTVIELTASFRASLREGAAAQQVDQRNVEERAELIAARLQNVRDGLNFAESFLQKVRSAQRLSHPFRTEPESGPIDGLLGELDNLQTRLSSVVESVDEIRRRVAESGDKARLAETVQQALGEVVHVIEVVESADEKLGKLMERVSQARTQASALEVETARGLWWAKVAASIVLPWMALGQLAMCILAWRKGGTT